MQQQIWSTAKKEENANTVIYYRLPATQTVLFQMPIEAMIDRLPPRHDRGVTRRLPQHRPSLSARARRARMKAMPPPFRGLRALATAALAPTNKMRQERRSGAASGPEQGHEFRRMTSFEEQRRRWRHCPSV